MVFGKISYTFNNKKSKDRIINQNKQYEKD